ncbi:sugar-binding protein [Lujinxingia litoralis]|nr:sugar-binding protein [Lujinxingia litoralis]
MNPLPVSSLRPTGALLLAAGALTLLNACGGAPPVSVDPFAIAESERQRTDILDAPTQAPRRAVERPTAEPDELYMIPEASAQTSRTIDAVPEGWDLSKLRAFDTRTNLIAGSGRWTGPEDASFKATVDADEGFIYFWVEVSDDVLVDSHPQDLLDGVVISLRDPQLDTLLNSLPATLRNTLEARADAAFAITPSGQIARYRSSHPLDARDVQAATRQTEGGYVLEVALGMGALPYIAAMPLGDIAFRIEVLDTDDARATRPEKHLSMFPSGDDQAPLFAVFDTGGLLPREAPQAGPPRFDALGAWHRGDQGWRFQPFEYIPQTWRVIEDLRQVAGQVIDKDPLPRICTAADREMWLVEVYEDRARNNRIALVLCGSAATNARCPNDATTQLVWAHMRPEDDQMWRIDRSFEVFETPLNQCPFERAGDGPLYSNFSLLPLNVIDAAMWAVGWQMRHDLPRQLRHESGIVFIDSRASSPNVGNVQLARVDAANTARTLASSRVYLANLDDVEGYDICEIEELDNQQCQGFQQGCETTARGSERIPHVKTWAPEAHRFERYLLTNHPNCRASTGFDTIEGFKILQVGNRLGLLPTPKSP